MKDEEAGTEGLGTREQGTAPPPSNVRSLGTPAGIREHGSAPEPLECAPLAYENPEFLNGADGRLMRIVAEYLEPLARFRREHIQDTVVFFGSARFRGREEADHELELLDNTGSSQAAPGHEQPASAPEIVAGTGDRLAAEARRGGGGDGPLLRGCAAAFGYADTVGERDSVAAAPVCGDLGRRAGDYGGGQSRRMGGRREDDRTEYPAAV